MKNSVAKMSSLVVVAFVLLSLLGIGCSLNTDSGPSAIEFVSAVQTGGTLGFDDSTGLTLTFDVDPTTLTVDDILLTGATKGELSGTGVTRSLAISAITVANG